MYTINFILGPKTILEYFHFNAHNLKNIEYLKD